MSTWQQLHRRHRRHRMLIIIIMSRQEKRQHISITEVRLLVVSAKIQIAVADHTMKMYFHGGFTEVIMPLQC